MADGQFPTLVSKDRDANVLANPIFVQISDGTNGISVDGSGNLQVILASNDGVDIGDVDVTSVVPGTGATNLGKAEDAAHASGDVGVMALAVRQDTPAPFAGDGDYVPLATNALGDLRVTLAGEEVEVTLNGELVDITGEDGAALHAPGNPIHVELSDGTGALAKATGAAAGATDFGIAPLAVRDDALSTLVDAEGDYVPLRVNDEGALWIAGNITASPESVHVDDAAFTVATDEVTAIAGIATSDSVDAGDVGALRMLTNRALVVTLEDAGGDGVAIDGSGNVAIDISTQTLAAVAVSKDNNANSVSNPIFVEIAEGVSTTEIHDYDTAAAVAGDASSNHDYTVAGTTFLLKKVMCASSGAAKFEVQTGPVASLASVAVCFIPKQGGYEEINFSPVREVPVTSTGTVRVIRTNREGSAQDLYSTIIGNDV